MQDLDWGEAEGIELTFDGAKVSMSGCGRGGGRPDVGSEKGPTRDDLYTLKQDLDLGEAEGIELTFDGAKVLTLNPKP